MAGLKQDSPSRSLTRPQHERLYRIFKMIADGGYPNCTLLARELEITRRTALRDLDYLRDRMLVPLDFDRKKNGYYLTQEVTQLPMIEISEADLALLYVAERSTSAQHTELARRLATTFARLSSILGDIVKTTWSELDEVLSFHATGAGKAREEDFIAVQKALRQRKVLKFQYQGASDARARSRTVHPHHLALVNHQWYLFAWDPSRKAMRTFSLARLAKPTLLDKTFEAPGTEISSQILTDSLGVAYKEKKNIRLRFEKDLAPVIRERVWHASQIIKAVAGGRIDLLLEVADTKELRNWIMSWGPRVRVVSPESLRSTIAALARETAALYSEE